MHCHFCYETVEHVCSAKGEKKEEGKEWWEDEAENIAGNHGSRLREFCARLVAEATARARAEVLREVEETQKKIAERMRDAYDTMKGEGV